MAVIQALGPLTWASFLSQQQRQVRRSRSGYDALAEFSKRSPRLHPNRTPTVFLPPLPIDSPNRPGVMNGDLVPL